MSVAQAMTKVITIIGVLLVVLGLAYHFAAPEIFNALVPKDKESLLWQSDVAYGSDPRQKLDIYMPREHAGDLPVVLFVHGGSWQKGNKNPYGFVGRAIAARGFMVMVINYRLHPQHRYPAFVDDVDLALRWAKENARSLGGDPDQLFAMGHSAGAYNVAMAALDERHAQGRPKLSGVVTLAGPFDFLPLDSPVTIEVFGGIGDLQFTQPVTYAFKDAPPFLILHGSADTTVYPRNAIALDKALREAGASSTLKIYDGVSHVGILLALSKWRRGSEPVLEDAAQFMKAKAR
jgi:acetyl esterase/lipase